MHGIYRWQSKADCDTSSEITIDNWHVYLTKSDVDTLLDALNPIGIREFKLKKQIEQLIKSEHIGFLNECDIPSLQAAQEGKLAFIM